MKIGIIGLDTSHAIQFTKRLQAKDCENDQKVEGLEIISCLRFETPFQDKKGLDERTAQLESWGVKVSEDFDEVIEGCEGFMLEINDGAYHLDYFEKVVKLNKPMFLDKPLADTYANGKKIYDLIKKYDAKVFSSSSLRFAKAIIETSKKIEKPDIANVCGPLGIAPAGESIVWYGVHTVEMLQRLMGRGAKAVSALRDERGVVAIIDYGDKRRGVVELNEDAWVYGGSSRTNSDIEVFKVDMSNVYKEQLEEISKFLNGGETPVDFIDTLEVMNILETIAKSVKSGKKEKLA